MKKVSVAYRSNSHVLHTEHKQEQTLSPPRPPVLSIVKLALSILAMSCYLTAPAYAVPGQDIETALKWARSRSILPKLTYNQEAYTYSGEKRFEKGQLFFSILFIGTNGPVTQELLRYRDAQQELNFTRDDVTGLRLLQKVYNRIVATDFHNSDYITRVGNTEFYQGQYFGYVIGAGQGFTMTRQDDLESLIRRARFCESHPSSCDV